MIRWLIFAVIALSASSQGVVARDYYPSFGYYYGYGYDQASHPAQPVVSSVVTSNHRLPDGTFIFGRYKVPASQHPENWVDPYSVPTSLPGRETVVVDGETLEVYRLQSHADRPLSIGSGKVKTLKTAAGKPRKVFVVE